MKINPGVMQALRNHGPFLMSRHPVAAESRCPDSPLRRTIAIPLGDMRLAACHVCGNLNFDFCWNCERPVCKVHAYAVYFPVGIALNVCGDCKRAIGGML